MLEGEAVQLSSIEYLREASLQGHFLLRRPPLNTLPAIDITARRAMHLTSLVGVVVLLESND
jgi:hypothetical protein